MARTHTAPLKTARWAALRNHVAHRAGFRCEHCNEFLGMTGQADHVVPRSICEDVGIGVYDPSNLQYLCTSCHSTKTNRERWGDRANPTERAKALRRVQVSGRDKFLEAAGISSSDERADHAQISNDPTGTVPPP